MKVMYDVTLSQTVSAKIQVKAEDAEQAEEIALEKYMRNEIEFSDSGIPGDVDISATKAEGPFEIIPIYWKDLTPEKQAEIMDTFGNNCNFDVLPIAELPVF